MQIRAKNEQAEWRAECQEFLQCQKNALHEMSRRPTPRGQPRRKLKIKQCKILTN